MNPEVQNANANAVGVKELSVQTAASLVGKVRMIDVREPAEYTGELGHIAKTELVPLATVEQAAANWDKNQELVMVCRSGNRSGRATETLTRLGFKHVVNMVGGMLAYNDAKLPIER
jgi:rhodanese-related sulfurtransferase